MQKEQCCHLPSCRCGGLVLVDERPGALCSGLTGVGFVSPEREECLIQTGRYSGWLLLY